MAAGPEGFRPMPQDAPVIGRGEPDLVRTALCVEPRNGLIHVFLPPLTAAEDWLALIAAVEDTAAETGRKVVLEGYLPPHDPRLNHFSVTPDPGVIEVNIHPAHNWAELVQRSEELYEEARQVGLATEKFMLDGAPCRHRRRQPRGDGRRAARRLSVPAPSRPAEVPARLLAQPSQPVVSVQRPVHRPEQPASAHR